MKIDPSNAENVINILEAQDKPAQTEATEKMTSRGVADAKDNFDQTKEQNLMEKLLVGRDQLRQLVLPKHVEIPGNCVAQNRLEPAVSCVSPPLPQNRLELAGGCISFTLPQNRLELAGNCITFTLPQNRVKPEATSLNQKLNADQFRINQDGHVIITRKDVKNEKD